MNSNWKLLPAALLVAVLAIAGCGGSGTPDEPPMASAYDTGLAAISAADTAEAAQAAYDDVDQTAVTGDEANKLMAALNTRLTEFRAAAQMAALAAAAGAIDTSDLSTQEAIDAANVAIGVLQMALDDATDVSDTSMYSAQLAAAQADVQAAVVELARQGRIADQKSALMSAAGAVDMIDLSTRDGIAAAKMAIAGLQAALDAAVDVSAADRAMYESRLNGATTAVETAEAALDLGDRQDVQRMALDGALDAAGPAVRAVVNDSTDAVVNAADMALAALKTAIDDAADLPGTEVGEAQGTYKTLMAQLNSAKERRTAAKEAKDDAEKAAMAITAAKLYAGISASLGTVATDVGTVAGAALDRAAAYAGTNDSMIRVSRGDGTNITTVDLSEDKDTMVAALHGWQGKRYADPAGGESVEAYVYSNIEAPTMGKKFGGAAADDEFEYALTDGELPLATINANPGRVVLSGVTRTSGTETFKLPDPNTKNEQDITVPGSYHGVDGTYICDTGGSRTDACTASVAASGFTLAGAWTFEPEDASDRVMDSEDPNYASYGWWLYKSEDGATYTASAFHDFKGAAGTVDIADLVGGTAKYVGGAAGKYALSSSTGGTNDAGHFTASATLEANFEDDMLEGTIDNFIGADGQSRDWSVELNKAGITTEGVILGSANGEAISDTNAHVGTVWTIGGRDAAKSGQWSANLREEGSDGVPKAATGTFYSTYDQQGKMVGAFGANKQ